LRPKLGRTVSGSVHFEGVDLLAPRRGSDARHTGNRIAMIFQEPMTLAQTRC